MCGRYLITSNAEAIRRLFAVTGPLPNFSPRYNAAPTQPLPVVRPSGAERQLALLRWGLVPGWSKGPDSRYSMINARAETVTSKPAYRGAFRARRCLVPADGFYEWQARRDGPKQPFLFTRADGEPMAFAGLWERWTAADGSETIESFTIVVCPANRFMQVYHDRMPVIVEPQDWEEWLSAEPARAGALMRPAAEGLLTVRAVGRAVNNVRNDGPEILTADGDP